MTTVQEQKRQERLARRRRIQRAAREVFADKGYAKTSIEQVARRATLSVGAIYLYFRSKEDLYISLLEESLEQIGRDLENLTTHDGLPAAWNLLVDWARNDEEGTRMMRLLSRVGIRKQLSDDVAHAIARGLEQIRNQLARAIRTGIDTGRYHAVDADATADALWALFLGTLMSLDARTSLGLPGPSFETAATAGFRAVESGLRTQANRVKEAA